MADPLDTLNRIKDEHLNIRRHLRLVGDPVGDVEAMRSLQQARTEWVPGRPDAFAERHRKLQQTLSFLNEGLRNHFALEEDCLPPLAGDLFMRALVMEHRETEGSRTMSGFWPDRGGV